jgi:hypothetical protein
MMKIGTYLLLVWFGSVATISASHPIHFRGLVRLPNGDMFSVSTLDGSTTAWVSVGDHFQDFTISGFAANENILELRREDQEWRVPLTRASIKPIEENDLTIFVSVLGSVNRPGRIEIRGEGPTALDVWNTAGGGQPGIGEYLILTRRGDDGGFERHRISLPIQSPETELEEALQDILLKDGDVLFFPMGAD